MLHRGALQRLGGGDERSAVASGPLPLALGQEVERGGERVGVDRGLDLEHLHPGVDQHLAHPPVALVQLALVLIHERSALLHGVHVVVVAQAAVAGQAGGGALPAAVHGHDVDVHVDEQVALRGTLVDLHLFAMGGGTEKGQVVRVLGVVLVEQAPGSECVVDPVADRMAELGLGHATVQGQGGDDVHVVDAGGGCGVEDRFDDALADVGSAHLGQRQAHVVEGDGELHAGEHLRRQRVVVDRGSRGRGGWRRRCRRVPAAARARR
jgi:hypothetical protein